MRNSFLLFGFLALSTDALRAGSNATVLVKPVCGNSDNGIVVGKPRLFDDRTLALTIDSLESRLATLRSLDGRPGKPGEEAHAEETQLLYQILNLRALSERALSDRVTLIPSSNGSQSAARPQAVVGFQISVDPRDHYTNDVAEVELTVTSHGQSVGPATLVGLLPKEKTYNVATVVRESSGLGDAVLQKLGDGYAVAKDTDTISLERTTAARETYRACTTGFHPSERDLTFAWQFRPVLGRDKVEAATRQVYALLALPTPAGDDYLADLRVHTHWRSLKKGRRKGNVDFLEDSARDEVWLEAIRYNSVEMERSLRPVITDVRFVEGAPGELTVIADGENFLPDTTVVAGTNAFAGAKLNIQRERNLQFTAPAMVAAQYDLFLTGRFGTPTPLLDPKALSPQWTGEPSWGLKIEYARARPRDFETSEVRIKIKSRERRKPLAELIVNKTLVSVGGRVFPVRSLETEPTDSDALLLRFDVPTKALRTSPGVTVARLFGGEAFRDSTELVLDDDVTATKVNLLAATDEDVLLAVSGSGFSSLAVVQIGGVTFTRWTKPSLLVSGTSMLTLRVPREMIRGARQLTVSQGFAQPVILPLPDIAQSETSRSKSRGKR